MMQQTFICCRDTCSIGLSSHLMECAGTCVGEPRRDCEEAFISSEAKDPDLEKSSAHFKWILVIDREAAPDFKAQGVRRAQGAQA